MTTLTLRGWRDPFAPLDALFRTLTTAEHAAAFTPAADVLRDGEDAVLRLELPGLNVENDVAVEVERGVVVVKGERRDEHTEDADGRILREVRYGSFRRAFRLPAHVTEADVSATYDAGVLTVRVTGAYAGSTPKRIPVSAGGAAPEAKAA